MKRLAALALAALAALGALAAGLEPVRPVPGGGLPLAGHLAVLEGPPADGPEAAREADRTGRFRPLPGFLEAGYRLQDAWLRFDLELGPEPAPEAWLVVEPAYLERITLYVARPDGGFSTQTAGAAQSGPAPWGRPTMAVFPLGGTGHPLPGGRATCFLRVQSRTTMEVRPALWEPRAFLADSQRSGLRYGAFYGVAGIVLVANLVFWFKLRNPILLLHAGYLGTMLAMFAGLDGHLAVLAGPGAPGAIRRITDLAIVLHPLLAVQLFSALAKPGQSWPRLDRAYRAAAALLALIGLAATASGHYFAFVPLLMAAYLALVLVNLAAAAVLALAGSGDARMYLLAFGPYLLGGVLRLVTIRGWAPLGAVGASSLQLGTLAHLGLLHLPLAERYRNLKRGLDRAQAEALAAALRQERELERRVAERTRELRAEQARTAEALARERQMVTQQRTFLAMVSHEFRTPLAIIDNAAQVARMAADRAPREVARRTDSIRRGVSRLLGLLDTWLTQDRIASGLGAITPAPMDPAALMEEALAYGRDQAPDREFRLDCRDLPATIPADRDLLRLALRNLLDNALKYSPGGGPVELAAEGGDAGVTLEVADHGVGIPADQLDQAADRFFRARNAGTFPGLGLGLHLVARIAELHRGRLELASTEGAGTRARLRLPATAGAGSPPPPPSRG